MEQPPNSAGKTTIAPDVLITIARLTTLAIDGVRRFSTVPSDVNQFFKRGFNVNDGVRVEVENNTVYADLYLVMKPNINVREVSRNVQAQVARAISEMVGMEVGKVNIHIEDIDYATPTETERA